MFSANDGPKNRSVSRKMDQSPAVRQMNGRFYHGSIGTIHRRGLGRVKTWLETLFS